jgi:hypothetical protein
VIGWYANPFNMKTFIWPGHPHLVTVQRHWPLTTGYDIYWQGVRVNTRQLSATELLPEVEAVLQRMSVLEDTDG